MHAYLIIAHNEFEVLKCLLSALDDSRNDIYIHFDKKVKELPSIACQHANLYVLEKRIDVRWGDYSQIETEMLLFESAFLNQQRTKTNYQYYHLLSGVDIPLKSQDYIHDFFSKNQGKEFIGYYQGELHKELKTKIGIYHLFPKRFAKEGQWNLIQILRAISNRIQLLCGGVRNKELPCVRGTNWVSITNDFVNYLIKHKNAIKKRYHHTFCADEIYKHILCWNSPFKDFIYDSHDEANGCMREINWIVLPQYSYLPSFTMKDYDRLKNSPYLFARKFDEHNLDIVKRLISDINETDN